MVYARKLYLITSTNLCPETIIEAKTTFESIWPHKECTLNQSIVQRTQYIEANFLTT